MSERDHGCVTNFDHGEARLTIWKNGPRFTLMEFGVFGATLPLTDDPIFQSIAAEVHRLACEVGRLRRQEIEFERAAKSVLKMAEEVLGDPQPTGADSLEEQEGRVLERLAVSFEEGRLKIKEDAPETGPAEPQALAAELSAILPAGWSGGTEATIAWLAEALAERYSLLPKPGTPRPPCLHCRGLGEPDRTPCANCGAPAFCEDCGHHCDERGRCGCADKPARTAPYLSLLTLPSAPLSPITCGEPPRPARFGERLRPLCARVIAGTGPRSEARALAEAVLRQADAIDGDRDAMQAEIDDLWRVEKSIGEAMARGRAVNRGLHQEIAHLRARIEEAVERLRFPIGFSRDGESDQMRVDPFLATIAEVFQPAAPVDCNCLFEGAYRPVPLAGERLFCKLCGGEIQPAGPAPALPKAECHCEAQAPPGFLLSGSRQDGERWTCPACGKKWIHVCGEVDGCRWEPS